MPRRKRVKSVPLRIPRRTYDSAEHLNLQTWHSKNVPIFAVLRSTEQKDTCFIGTSGDAASGSSRNFVGE